VPYPSDADTFWQLVQLGGELRQIHLLESPSVEHYITQYPESGSNQVTALQIRSTESHDGDGAVGRVYINDTQYFANMPQLAWEFFIGGYQPAQKWLKDRKGRTLSAEDIAHYQKIVVALHETIRLMAEIDVVIEEHGGWPGAFHVADASVADEPARPQFGQVTASAPKRKAAEDKDQGSFLDE
jgi:hypothetical protein